MPSPPSTRLSGRLVAVVTRLLVAVLMLGVAIAVFSALRASKPEVQQVDPAANAPTVIVFEAQRVPVQRQWRGYGTAEPLDSAEVPVRVTATVDAIPDGILPGARVTVGQTLVELDASDFERQLEIAEQRIAELEAALAQLDVEQQRLEERLALEETEVSIAQTDFDRQRRFVDRNVGNQQDLDAAQRTLIAAQRNRLQTQQSLDLVGPRRRSLEAQIASQRSQVNLAQLNQQRTTVTSPIDGVLQSINVEVGENMMAGSVVARVVALDHIEVPLDLPAAAQASVRPGDRVTLRPTNLPVAGPVWQTTVARVAPEQDAATRTLRVFAELRQDKGGRGLPVPGMYLEGRVAVAEAEPRFVVPRRAIRGGRVQVVEDGIVVSRAVDVDYNLTGPQPGFGLPDDQWAVVDDVLAEGDLVVVNAATRLADGRLVEPVMADPPSTTASKPAPTPSDKATP
ncbi:MAG: efflux RND transporter periplasmic adaptor subunit [Planctomycetota bacterium]